MSEPVAMQSAAAFTMWRCESRASPGYCVLHHIYISVSVLVRHSYIFKLLFHIKNIDQILNKPLIIKTYLEHIND